LTAVSSERAWNNGDIEAPEKAAIAERQKKISDPILVSSITSGPTIRRSSQVRLNGWVMVATMQSCTNVIADDRVAKRARVCACAGAHLAADRAERGIPS